MEVVNTKEEQAVVKCCLVHRSSPSSRCSPLQCYDEGNTLMFTPATGPSIDEAYTLKPGPRNLMNVSGYTGIVLQSIILGQTYETICKSFVRAELLIR